MFQSVRHWWTGGRGKVTVRLFAFEFMVVVAGVLVAQAVAGYAQRRDELAEMEAERARMLQELSGSHAGVLVWLAAIPCLRQRLESVMARADMAPGSLKRPGFSSPGFVAPSAQTMDLIAHRYGTEYKVDHEWLSVNSNDIGAAVRKIRETWGRVTLADPIHGPVSADDRTAAKAAAADVLAQLQLVEGMSEDVVRLSRKHHIKPVDFYSPDTGPAKSCNAIWRSGQIYPPLDMR